MICYAMILKGLNGYQRSTNALRFWENSSGHLYILPASQQKDESKLEKVTMRLIAWLEEWVASSKRQRQMCGLLSLAK